MICCIACSVIAFNLIDYYINFSAATYGKVLSFLNALEASILITLGIKVYKDVDSRSNEHNFKRLLGFSFDKLSYADSLLNIRKPKKEKV